MQGGKDPSLIRQTAAHRAHAHKAGRGCVAQFGHSPKLCRGFAFFASLISRRKLCWPHSALEAGSETSQEEAAEASRGSAEAGKGTVKSGLKALALSAGGVAPRVSHTGQFRESMRLAA